MAEAMLPRCSHCVRCCVLGTGAFRGRWRAGVSTRRSMPTVKVWACGYRSGASRAVGVAPTAAAGSSLLRGGAAGDPWRGRVGRVVGRGVGGPDGLRRGMYRRSRCRVRRARGRAGAGRGAGRRLRPGMTMRSRRWSASWLMCWSRGCRDHEGGARLAGRRAAGVSDGAGAGRGASSTAGGRDLGRTRGGVAAALDRAGGVGSRAGSADPGLQAPAIAAGLPESGGPEGKRGYVWHCSARVAGGDRVLSDAEWGEIARDLLHGAGVAAPG